MMLLTNTKNSLILIGTSNMYGKFENLSWQVPHKMKCCDLLKYFTDLQ